MRSEETLFADLKTPPRNLGTAKFSPATAEEILAQESLALERSAVTLALGQAVKNISVLTSFKFDMSCPEKSLTS